MRRCWRKHRHQQFLYDYSTRGSDYACESFNARLQSNKTAIFGLHQNLLKSLSNALGRLQGQIWLATYDLRNPKHPTVYRIAADLSNLF